MEGQFQPLRELAGRVRRAHQVGDRDGGFDGVVEIVVATGAATSWTATTSPLGTTSSCGVCTPSRQLITVDGVSDTGPPGSVDVIVISSLVHVMPIAVDSRCRAVITSAPGGGARSWGSSDTASPTVKTLPSRASRSVCGGTDVDASREPETVIARAAATAAGVITTSDPSTRPMLVRVMSSSNTTPGRSSLAAASAALARAPVSRTASHCRRPRASSTSGCSRTTPRRVSRADGDSRAVSVICGEVTPASLRVPPPVR
ncbi:hypothetical protein GCM10029964_002880 [Kibdelosporangium lantanae]